MIAATYGTFAANEGAFGVTAPYTAFILLYCSGIFWASAHPDPVPMEMPFPGADKIVHAVVYGGLAAAVSVGLRRSGRSRPPRVQFWAPVVFAGLYGFSDEVHQLFVPLRNFDVFDIAADLAGALLVQIPLCWIWRRAGVLATQETFPASEE